MNRLRVFVTLLTVAVVAVLVIVLLVASQLDLKSVKREAEWQLRNALGLHIRFAGDLRLSLFPYLGVKTGQLSVSVPGNWDLPLLEAADLVAELELIPLLRGRVVIGRVVANGLVLNLERTARGVANWEAALMALQKKNLGDTESVEASKESTSVESASSAVLEVTKLLVRDASVRFRDREQGLERKIYGFGLETGRIRNNRPINFKSTLQFASRWPDLRGNAKLVGQFRLDLVNTNMSLTGLVLHLTASGPAIPEPHGTAHLFALASYDHRSASLALPKLTLTTEAIEAEGELIARNLTSFPEYHGQIGIATLNLPAVVARRSSVSTNADKAAFSATFSASAERLRVDNLMFSLGDATLAGDLEATAGHPRQVRVNLRGGHFDLRRLLHSLAITARHSNAKMDQADGSLMSLASPARAESFFDGRALLTAFRGFLIDSELEGRLSLEGVLVPHGALKGVLVRVQGADGYAWCRASVAEVANGTVRMDILVTVRDDSSELRGTLAGQVLDLNIAELPAAPHRVEGRLGLKFFFSTQGRTMEELAKTAAGRIIGTGRGLGGLEVLNVGSESTPLTPQVVDLDFRLTPRRDFEGRSYHRVVAAARIANPPAARAAAVRILAPIALEWSDSKIPKIGHLRVQAVAVNGAVDGIPQFLSMVASNRIDLAEDKLDIEWLEVTVNGQPVRLSGRLVGAMGSSPSLQGLLEAQRLNPAALIRFVGSEVPLTGDPQALTFLSVQIPFMLRKTGAQANGLRVRLDDTTLEGRIAFTSGDAVTLNANLKGDSIDLDRYLPLEPEPTESSKRPLTSSPDHAAGSGEDSPVFDFSPLQSLNLEGKLRFGRIVWQGYEITDLSVAVRSQLGRLKMEPFRAKLLGGAIEGSFEGDFTADEASILCDLRLAGVDLEQVHSMAGGASASLQGRLDLRFKGNARGTTIARLKQTLSGRLGLKVRDGAIHQVADNRKGPTAVIPVTRAVARFQVRDGEFFNNDLVMASDRITVRGRGRFNLAEDTIDYSLTATYAGTVKAPVTVRGRLSDPAISVELAEALGGTGSNILNLPYRLLDPLVVPRLR